MSEHTNWRLKRSSGELPLFMVEDCGEPVSQWLDEERARLIAAAPELLALLDQALPFIGNDRASHDGARSLAGDIRKAIAKTRGES